MSFSVSITTHYLSQRVAKLSCSGKETARVLIFRSLSLRHFQLLMLAGQQNLLQLQSASMPDGRFHPEVIMPVPVGLPSSQLRDWKIQNWGCLGIRQGTLISGEFQVRVYFSLRQGTVKPLLIKLSEEYPEVSFFLYEKVNGRVIDAVYTGMNTSFCTASLSAEAVAIVDEAWERVPLRPRLENVSFQD